MNFTLEWKPTLLPSQRIHEDNFKWNSKSLELRVARLK